MKTIMVMDKTGDSRVTFDETKADDKATAEARELFDKLRKGGHAVFAVNRGAGLPDQMVTRFEELGAENVARGPIAGG